MPSRTPPPPKKEEYDVCLEVKTKPVGVVAQHTLCNWVCVNGCVRFSGDELRWISHVCCGLSMSCSFMCAQYVPFLSWELFSLVLIIISISR